MNKSRRAYLALGVLLAAITSVAIAGTFNLFSPATGVLKGNSSTYVTTAAASSDIRALWSGTCNASSFLRGDGACVAAGTGTVTSAALTMPTGFSVSGSPITGSGTFGVTTTLNGPLRGNGSGFITGSLALGSEVSGTLPVANGGTGAATLTGVLKGNGVSAFTAAASADVVGLWSGTCNASSFLRGDGACAAAGAGSVTSVSLTMPTGFSVSGSPVTGSGTFGVTTALSGVLHGNGSGFTASNVTLTSEVTGILPVANGGLNLSAATDDNIPVGNGTTWQSKAVPNCGSSTQALAYNTTTNAFSCQTISASTSFPLRAPDGLVSAPSYSFSSSTSSGLWFDGVGVNLNDPSFITLTAPTVEVDASSGVFTGGATGSAQGAGTINAQGLFVNGTTVCQSNGTNCPTGSLQAKFRTSNNSITSNTGLSADAQLSGFTLAANGRYVLHAQLTVSQSGGTAGFQHRLSCSAGTMGTSFETSSSYSNGFTSNVTDNTNTAISNTQAAASQNNLLIDSVILAGAGGCTLQFEWAQAASSASATNLQAGSTITITKVN